MKDAYLGPEFSDTKIEAELNACGAIYKKRSENKVIEEVDEALAD
jgi:predicted NodU family carbamoyl transferase